MNEVASAMLQTVHKHARAIGDTARRDTRAVLSLLLPGDDEELSAVLLLPAGGIVTVLRRRIMRGPVASFALVPLLTLFSLTLERLLFLKLMRRGSVAAEGEGEATACSSESTELRADEEVGAG